MPVLGLAASAASLGILSLKDYGGKCDGRWGFAGTVNNTTTFTATDGTFTQADVGKLIWVNAGMFTIASVQSGTQLTLSSNPGYSQAGNVPYVIGTDDTAAVAATIAALPANGGTIIVPGLTFDTATHTFTARTNIHFIGLGGIIDPGKIALTGGGQAAPTSGLLYTGSGTGGYLTFVDCLGCSVKDMAVLYAVTGYTGDLVSFVSSNGTTPGRFFNMSDVALGSMLQNVNHQANCLVNLSGAIFADFNNVSFGYAKYHVIGEDPNGTGKGWVTGFSNAVTFRGSGTEFANAKLASVLNPGESWNFLGVTFEPIQGAKAGAITCSSGTKNLRIVGCGFWDALTAGGTWITTAGERISIRDCYIEDAGNNDVFIDASTASTAGLTVDSCQFDGYSNPTGTKVLKPPTDGGANFLTGFKFTANTYKNGTADPSSLWSGNANVTTVT